MKIDEAFVEIEETLRKVDARTLYEPLIGRELQNILRRIRNEKKEEAISDIQKL